MTTNIKITTNGNYVSEGTVKLEGGPSGTDGTTSVKVGPGSMKEFSVGVPHGVHVTIDLAERSATADEIAALTAGGTAA